MIRLIYQILLLKDKIVIGLVLSTVGLALSSIFDKEFHKKESQSRIILNLFF
jgi:hypothetical protein